MFKVGDQVIVKTSSPYSHYVKEGDIGHIIYKDIFGRPVYGVSKDKSLLGENIDDLDNCDYGLFHKERLEKVLLDKEDNAQDMTIEVKDNKVRVFLGDKEVDGLTKVEFSANLEEAPKLNLEMIPKKEMIK